ncbi:hypothetical protein GWO43_09200, partial [candidate division KSB1 bacterium]|nr:hypothetical protein [candidate division KSB1 bacterium]NIR69282.1 hypothetical protein [candidate division KSB1 bacterium]NIS24143.1 hypothetical protein [candidate division KSB1 bacterium]NIT71057.1 hypothetical protein [candidate division KSB1 bacterium]NIU24762.1 hypothetical protein [candidate division KSB1 bacterium]
MKRRIIVAVSVSGALGVAIALVLWWRTPGDTDDLRDFDWDAIKAMIVTGASTNDRYSVEEVKLDRVPMPSAKVFFVVDKQFEALLGPKQALVLYYPEAKALNHDPELLKMIFERRQYKANSPDELLTLVAEVAPLLYGSRPAQHEILTRSNMVGSGSFPITTDTI